MSNGTRFISAYNKLDNALRKRYDLKSNLTFPETVRISAQKNSVVRKHEDDLMDYGRLRNAIVHKSDSDIIIAEPHLSVVENFEKIAELVGMPPRADKTVAKVAVSLDYKTKLRDAISLMARSNFSNVPIMQNGKLAGVLNNKIIVEAISENLDGNVSEFINASCVGGILHGNTEHYKVARQNVTIDIVLQYFTENPKLQIVLLSSNGEASGDISGIITTGDLFSIHKILD